MMFEVVLIDFFKSHSVDIFPIAPVSYSYPCILFDRISSDIDTVPGYDSYSFAFDVIGKKFSDIDSGVTKVTNILKDLSKNGSFPVVDIYNVINNTDNSQSKELTYTVYARFVYRKAVG